MIPRTLADVARITTGRLTGGADPAAVVDGPVVVDSRRATAGALFVAVTGAQLDGHAFATDAIAAGAVAVLAGHELPVPAVVVADPVAALAALARDVVTGSAALVVGVTGSSGKTSTKDLAAAVLGAAAPTVAAEGSFNNEIGLPLTACRITAQTRYLVLEYSARGLGHIAYLTGIVRPEIAIVLNVGVAHLGEFGSRETIAIAKGELPAGLDPNGTAVLNADDPLVAAMAERTDARVVTFGTLSTADVVVRDVQLDDLARPSFHLHTPSGSADVKLALHGRHHAMNAAAVVAAALAADLPFGDIVDAVQQVRTLSPHRMQMLQRADGLLVIDDAYNANPESMRAALQAAAEMATGRGQLWAVFGAMRELGPETPQLHRDVGRFAAELGVDELIAVGPDAAAFADGAVQVAGWSGHAQTVPDAAAARAALAAASGKDVVVVKASNSERLWRVAEELVSAVGVTA